MSSANDAPVGLLLSDDLIDASRVTATARAAGCIIRHIRNFDLLLKELAAAPFRLIILDLHHPELRIDDLMRRLAESAARPKCIGYGSHVDAERLKNARRAGVDEVMPRSQFFSEGLEKLAEWSR